MIKFLKKVTVKNEEMMLRLINNEELIGQVISITDEYLKFKLNSNDYILYIPVDKILYFYYTSIYKKFTDQRDGKTYRTIDIDGKTWMVDNLAYITQEGSCAYNNKNDNIEKYGLLYNYEAMHNACPNGWHIPTTREWIELERFITKKETMQQSNLDKKIIWEVVKEYKEFNPMPAGYCDAEGNFKGMGEKGYWHNYVEGTKELLEDVPDEIKKQKKVKSAYLSIRCVKD